jgi:hypothetical protein
VEAGKRIDSSVRTEIVVISHGSREDIGLFEQRPLDETPKNLARVDGDTVTIQWFHSALTSQMNLCGPLGVTPNARVMPLPFSYCSLLLDFAPIVPVDGRLDKLGFEVGERCRVRRIRIITKFPICLIKRH